MIKNIVLVLVYIIIIIPLHSQNKDIDIAEIIVTEDSNLDVLNSKIKVCDVLNFPPGTTGEIFENISGLNIIKRSGFSIEPSLHLFKREQLNIMIDGGTKITQSCANRMDAMTTRISSNEIDKIELIKGPYSVRFGQSFGGVINIITKHSQGSENIEFHGSGNVGYEFNGGGFSSGLEFGASEKKINFLINGTLRNFGNYISGDDTEIISSFKAYDYSAKLTYNLNRKSRIQASFRQSFAKDVMHAGLPMDALNDNGKVFAMDYNYASSTNVLSGIKIKVYGSLVDHLMTNEFKKTFKFAYAIAPVSSETIGGKSEFKLSLSNKLKMFAGFDYFYKTRDGVRNREVKINACTGMVFSEPKGFIDKIWQNSLTADYGAFAEINYKYSENTLFKLGFRSDFIQSNILDPENDFTSFYGDNIKPKAQNSIDFFTKVDFKLPKGFKFSIAAGKASRTPDLLELFINHSSVGQDAYEYLGNPSLKAEKNMQTDIVISQKKEKYFAYVDVFYSYITDFITAKVDTTIPRKFTPCKLPAYTKQFVNVDKVFQYGIDAGIKIKLIENLIFITNVNYTFAQNITWDEPVSEISPLSFNTNIIYVYKNFNFTLRNRYVAAQERVAVSFGETNSEAFDIVDLNVFYKPFKFINIGFGIDNITDINYYEHTSRSYRNLTENSMFFEPGRNFKILLKVDF